MISLRDTITLARAKLHTKRIMLAITIVVSGLSFGILCAAGLLATGISKSAHAYTRTALDGQYLVKSQPIIPPEVFGFSSGGPSAATIATLTTLQATYISQQKDLAKKLKLSFDPQSVAPILLPNPYAEASVPADRRVRINFDSPVYPLYTQKLQTEYVATAKNKLADLKTAAAPYGATAFHQNQSVALNYANTSYLAGGKEDLSKLGPNARPQGSDQTTYGYLTASVRNSSYSLVDDALIKRFILPVNDKRRANLAAIPVVITTTEAMTLFGQSYNISQPPVSASQQIAWMKALQQKLNGTTYTACYRNEAEISELTTMSQAAAAAAEHKDDKTYVPPALSYSPPTAPCGDITVKQDKRSADEKKAAQDQIALSQALGAYEAPQHQLLTFMIVGVMPVSPQTNALTSLPNFMSSLLGAQYGAGAMIPQQLFGQLPAAAQHKDVLLASSKFSSSTLTAAGIGEAIVSFPSVGAARSFIHQQGCPPDTNSCGKPFTLEPYGSNYLLADDIDTTVTKALRTALPFAILIAGIIIWATMARVIIDSRRETAVFRAIGAKRRDIMAVYLLYSLIVAARIVAFSLILGLGIAFTVQALYSAQVTDYAKVTFGVFDRGQSFSFIGFDPAQLIWLVASIIGISLVAILPPLLRNVRRSPISDMRDE
ncbi:MAG TPA: FtsX-like permease family protein [Candidatus Saccharimonadia bacterium]|nr:FtsX-like permease family protein [Candidatus Saccharimonadia bacterium]